MFEPNCPCGTPATHFLRVQVVPSKLSNCATYFPLCSKCSNTSIPESDVSRWCSFEEYLIGVVMEN